MRTGICLAALLALGMGAGLSLGGAAQAQGGTVRGSHAVSMNGTVTQVDADRDRLTLTGDDGHTYTVDTYRSNIVLRDTRQAGQTADLVPGMRLHITGPRLSTDVIEADEVSVLPYHGGVRPAPVRVTAPPADGRDQHVTLRGTVQSVDDRQGTFVVQVNDHTRKVFVDDQTDLRDLHPEGGERLPVRAGDRVTVVGDLQDDGTVQVLVVTPRRLDETPVVPGRPSFEPVPRADQGRTLLGRVSKESDYFSRDIKIRLAVNREITVHVPKNIPIRRNGHGISVHDLKDDQVVRVTGDYQNDDFKASRIELLDDSVGDRLDF